MTKEILAGNVSLVQIILGCVELRVPETRSTGKSNRQVRYEYETPQHSLSLARASQLLAQAWLKPCQTDDRDRELGEKGAEDRAPRIPTSVHKGKRAQNVQKTRNQCIRHRGRDRKTQGSCKEVWGGRAVLVR